ncbi:MAG: hypothetical protein KKH74_00705 [Gammaproteobacteria bacterium]|nr:hypothetical protein [Gammaproteobacteria bacterium]MBU1733370.1 hypothetical protein [Gammaproteobacteria bacterium]MBU1891787.1 hypothetical protein [Gammaproteobacteria bacterium]
MIRITPQLAIEEREIVLQFIRASGPGGQNVKRVYPYRRKQKYSMTMRTL